MNVDVELMMRIYGTYEYDWMGYPFSDPSELSRHHIVKKQYDGENGVSNYALLTKTSHIFLHYMEDNYNKEYNQLNELFLELNRSLKPPTQEYYERVHKIVKSVRKRQKNKSRAMKR